MVNSLRDIPTPKHDYADKSVQVPESNEHACLYVLWC